MEAVKLHAAMWYELALGEGAYSGNEAKIVQGRIDETKSYGGAAMQDKATLAKQVKELKPIVLPLKGKTVVEFVGVPAGEFMMGTDMETLNRFKDAPPSLLKKHEVIITRPFWLSKYKVTKELWNVYQKTELTGCEKSMGGMKIPKRDISYIDVMAFCEWLTRLVRGKLPSGYIVRLPTEAECEYAFFVNETTSDSLYRNWETNISRISFTEKDIRSLARSRNVDTEDTRIYECIEVGMKEPNGIGLFDMLGNGREMMFDTFNGDCIEDDGAILDQKNVKQTAISYPDKESDPLRFYSGKNSRVLLRGSYWTNWDFHPYAKRGMTLHHRWIGATFRLCIGPNLMKEKGYSFKPGKKK